MNRKVAIGVVTYRPNINLTHRLKSAIDVGFSVYIFDNSPDDELIRRFCRGFNNDVVRYITCGKNVGLGFGISSVCAQAYYDSYPALVFFDQDTVFDGSTLDFIELFYIKNVNLASNYSAFVFNDKNLDDARIGKAFEVKDVLMAINSGSLYILENLKRLNWHNETYFVDCVDYEFCLNSNNNGLKIGECSTTPGFDHRSEQGDVKYTIFGRDLLMRKYPVKRFVDAAYGGLRVLLASIMARNINFAAALGRIWVKYIASQFLVRVLSLIKINRRFENEF